MQINVSQNTFERLKAYCKEHNRFMKGMADKILGQFLDDEQVKEINTEDGGQAAPPMPEPDDDTEQDVQP